MVRILLVEDDLPLASGIRYALEREGWEVEFARSAKEAAKALREQAFDLLLLDVMLPDGSGFDICREVRKTSDVPIVFLTACDEEVNVVMGLDIGADDYVTKPFRVRELTSRIRANLRRFTGKGQDTPRLIRSGDISVDLAERRVMKGSTEIALTTMEFKLLLTLMQHPGQVLTREQILSKLWDSEGEFIDDNTLSVYVRRLRTKIEDDPSKPQHILTARGWGYKWNRRDGR